MTLPSLLGAWRLCDQKKELERKAVEKRDSVYASSCTDSDDWDIADDDVRFAKTEHDRAIELYLMELKSWMQEP